MTQAKPPTPGLPIDAQRAAAERIAAEIAAEPPELQRWMCFTLAGVTYALNVLQLREVLPRVTVEPVPGAPPAVRGVLNLRGEIVTLLDLRRWLDLPAGPGDGPVLVLEHAGQSLGLRVDAVGALLKRMPDDLLAPPASANPRLAALACGRTTDGVETLTLLDGAALFADTAQGG